MQRHNQLLVNMDITVSQSYVAENGTDLEKARLGYILYGTTPPKKILDDFRRLQNPDGGFACGFTAGNHSSIERTQLALWWLDELGMLKSPTADRSIDFLLRKQADDGSWDEDQGLNVSCLPPWIIPGDLLTKLYLTAYSAFWLGITGHKEDPAFWNALDYLITYQIDRGGFFGYIHTTWLATSDMLMAGSKYSDNANQGLHALMARQLDEFAASQLAWMLNCFSAAGMPNKHPVSTPFLIKLRQLRRSDGSWGSEDGDFHAVDATVESIRALKYFGLITSIA
jgi:prenyltransferase beta subunit